MIFHVDPASAKPVYQQLIDQVKLAIAARRIRAGDQLPTVRDLSVQLKINRNTVARVYSELEREGVLYTRTGHGTFISDQVSPFSSAEQRRQLGQLADDLIVQARIYGYSRKELELFVNDRCDVIFKDTEQQNRKVPQKNKGGAS